MPYFITLIVVIMQYKYAGTSYHLIAHATLQIRHKDLIWYPTNI